MNITVQPSVLFYRLFNDYSLQPQSHVFQREAVPFVMELPNYRIPGAKSVLLLMWNKAKDFLQIAFTVIFVGTIIVWFLQNFNFSLHMVDDSSQSILAAVVGLIAPLFVPLGLGNWRMVTTLISGFLAKESVVSMLTVLYGSTQLIQRSIIGLATLSSGFWFSEGLISDPLKTERNISNKAIESIIKNPLHKTDVMYDDYEKPFVIYIGKKILVVVNPETDLRVTVRRTTKRERSKWKK